MRRTVAALLGLVALGALAVVLAGAGGDDQDGKARYRIELDNAFGLIEGADLKIAGVRAGRIDDMTLDRSDMRAIVKVSVDREGFGDLRTDASCETRPQSLIGEYFIDCKPGTKPERLPDNGLVPVKQTLSTVPVDLVNNIMRRPYRERFSIIFSELGGALTARGDDLNETIRRASPALREVDRVLAILREQRRTIRDLYADADAVVGKLATKRRDVTTFIAEARDTAKVGAENSAAVRRQLRAFPTFLSELQQTMPQLGRTAERQTTAIRTLRTQAPRLREFLDALGTFAERSRPAVRSLGEAAVEGRRAVLSVRPRLVELSRPAATLPELSRNLAYTLEHLDDRRFAVEKDPRTPGGQGLTGYEAILRYVFAQSQSINLFDADNYILKIAGFLDRDCGFVQNAESAKAEAQQRCAAVLGQGRPGIDEPDPSKTTTAADATRTRRESTASPQRGARAGDQAPTTTPGTAGGGSATTPSGSSPLPPAVQELLDDVLPGGVPQTPLDKVLPGLDYLLSP